MSESGKCLEACVLASHRLCLISPSAALYGSSLPSEARNKTKISRSYIIWSWYIMILWSQQSIMHPFFLTMAKLEDGETAGHCTKGVRLPLGNYVLCPLLCVSTCCQIGTTPKTANVSQPPRRRWTLKPSLLSLSSLSSASWCAPWEVPIPGRCQSAANPPADVPDVPRMQWTHLRHLQDTNTVNKYPCLVGEVRLSTDTKLKSHLDSWKSASRHFLPPGDLVYLYLGPNEVHAAQQKHRQVGSQ